MYKRLKLAFQSVYQSRIKEIELLHQRNAELEQQLQHSTIQLQEAKAAVERQGKQAALLNQIVHAMRETLVLDDILQIAANNLHKALNVSSCLIFRPDANNQLGIRYVSESTSEGNTLIGLQCNCYRHYHSQLANGQPLVLPRIEASEPPEILKAVEKCNIRALMIVPLIYQQHFIGGISLNESEGERDWTSEEVQFVKSIADHCAIAIHQAELYQQAQTELQKRKKAQAALLESVKRERLIRIITQRIHQSLNLDEILRTTVAEVRHFLQTDRVIVFQIEPDGSGLVVEESVSDSWSSVHGQLIFDSCLPNYIEQYRQGRIRAITDIDDGTIKSCHANFLRHFDVRANLTVPIIHNDHLWGLLIAHHCADSRQWSIAETELLNQVGKQVAIAIQQAQLFQQVQNELADRIQAETFLRESEARFRLMADSAPVLIWLADAEGECTFFNQTWLKFTGRSLRQEVQGSWTESILPSDLEQYLDHRINAIKARKKFSLEYRLRRRDGEYRWILEKGVPSLTPNGELVGYIGSCIDITQRKQVEVKLQKLNEELEIKVQERTQELQQTVEKLAEEIFKHCHTETQLTIALEAALMGTWDWNLQTNQLKLSPRSESIFGFAPGFFPGTQEAFINCIYPKDRPAIEQSIQQTLLNKTPHNSENRIIWPDGTIHWISCMGNLICNQTGQPIRMTGVVIDINERKLAEKALRTSLKEKEVLLKEIHHRVKNNLQIISSLLKLQSSYIKDEEVITLFAESYNRVRSMALLHEKLYHSVDLARINADDYICNLTKNLFSSYNVSFSSLNLKTTIDNIKLDIDTAIPCGLIINELVTNSLKYAFPGIRKGQICITFLQQDNNTLYLKVSDDGVGLPPDFDIEQIQSLGLQLVVNLTEQLGGKLEIDSTNGTSFAITFVPHNPLVTS